jgi:hypothetical protein
LITFQSSRLIIRDKGDILGLQIKDPPTKDPFYAT